MNSFQSPAMTVVVTSFSTRCHLCVIVLHGDLSLDQMQLDSHIMIAHPGRSMCKARAHMLSKYTIVLPASRITLCYYIVRCCCLSCFATICRNDEMLAVVVNAANQCCCLLLSSSSLFSCYSPPTLISLPATMSFRMPTAHEASREEMSGRCKTSWGLARPLHTQKPS